jgi:hypothetical protein
MLHLAATAPALAQARGHQEDGAGVAPAKPALGPGSGSAPTHVTREGGVERRLWIDTGHVAEFGSDGAPAIRAASVGEVEAVRRGGSTDAKASAFKDQTQKQSQAAAGMGSAAGKPVSPVFLDASGRPRALPGGVIVSLKQALAEDDARAALDAAGLVPLRRIGERMWLVESPPGIESLEMANRLQEEGRFGFAQPNWWQPKTTK